MLLPRQADHDAQAVLRGEVEQPERRRRVGAHGVDPAGRHLREVLRHALEVGELLPVLVGPERAVGDAADVELLVAGVQELARRARSLTGAQSTGRACCRDVVKSSPHRALPSPLQATAVLFDFMWSYAYCKPRRGRLCAAARRSGAPSSPARPGTPSSSSALAASRRSAEPKCWSSARRRTGPTPSSWSNIDSRARASRRWRWKRDREAVRLVADPLQELQAGGVLRQHDRLRPARDEDLLDPLRERDHRDARQVVALHRRERRRELALAAVDHDEVRRRAERLVPLLGRRPAASRPKRRETTSAIAAKSSWPSWRVDAELAVVRLLRDARPRTRPSSRRSPGPGCSRCRSTRSGSAAPPGSASRAAPRAPRRGAAASTRRRTSRTRAPARRSAARAPAAAASRRARARAPRPASRAARTGTRRAPPCRPARAARGSAAGSTAPSRSTRGRTARAPRPRPRRRRSRGGTSSGRSSARRGAGRPAPPPARARRRRRSRRSSPIDRRSTAWRSASRSTARSRLR